MKAIIEVKRRGSVFNTSRKRIAEAGRGRNRKTSRPCWSPCRKTRWSATAWAGAWAMRGTRGRSAWRRIGAT